MPHFVVEYEFDPPVTEQAMGAAFESLKPCLEVRGVRRLRSWLADDRKRAICEYEAADTQSLRDAYRAASVGYARIWAGKLFEFGPANAQE
jgi:hypothetical protein